MTLTREWEQRPVLSQRDSGRSTLEDQLPALIRVLEIGKAEAERTREEEERRADIRKDRWEEVRKAAFVRVAYERNAERLRAELGSRDVAATRVLRPWRPRPRRHFGSGLAWIREHAERTDPLNWPLRLARGGHFLQS